MTKKARSQAYAETIEKHYRQQLYYMKNLEDLTDRLKSERHDSNHHLGVIYGLLESGDSDKAGQYASQLVKTAGDYQNLVNVPYPMVRAILNYKLSAAKEKNIRLKLHVGIPEGFALPGFDLTVILGNLLENAVEACTTVNENDPLNEKVNVIQSIIHLTQRVFESRLRTDFERNHGPFCGIPV